jgi:hypothetical protein
VTDCARYDILPFDELYVPGGIAFVLQYRSVISVFFVNWICATLQCGACVRGVCVCMYVCIFFLYIFIGMLHYINN